jgi:hypothetical protein
MVLAIVVGKMKMHMPLKISAGLVVRVGAASVRMTPRESMHVAERLIRLATRRMVVEEAEQPARRRAPELREKDH